MTDGVRSENSILLKKNAVASSRSPVSGSPWLDAVAAWIDKTRQSGGHGAIACSALKRRYRDALIGKRADVRLVYLEGDETLIARRIATRHEHFMPPSLLHSQFDALEPGPDENPIIVSISHTRARSSHGFCQR
jgi:gluconokinase